MSEEAQYTDYVPEYKSRSRLPILSRYRDLIILVKNAFSDNVITDTELQEIETLEKDILLEYQIAADIFFKLDYSSPQYAATQKLLNHLHRCNVFMQFAYKHAKEKNASGMMSVPERDRYQEAIALNDDKVIQITASMAGINLLKELDTPEKRIQADLPRIRRDLSRLTPEERAEWEAKINAMIEQLQERQLEQLSVYELNRLIGLEHYLMDEKERVRDM